MKNVINVSMKAKWQRASQWSGALSITLVNNTGAPLHNPEIKIQLGQNFNALLNTGYTFTQSGTLLTGHLSSHLATIASGASVSFSVEASFPSGGNTQALPVSYWVNGQLTADKTPPPDTIKPTTPQNLTVSGSTPTSVSLRWDASTDNVGISGYQVRYTAAGVSKTLHVKTTSCTLSNLTTGTAYSCSVAAVDVSNNVSDWSAAVSVTPQSKPDTTKPSIPQNLTVTHVTSTTITLSWSASTGNNGIAGYQVRFTTAGVSKTVSVTSTCCTLSQLTTGTLYNCCVAAVDTSQKVSDWSPAVNATPQPDKPSASIPFAPYIDVTINANWNATPPQMNTQYITHALGLGVRRFYLAFLVNDTASGQLVWGNSSFPYASAIPLCNTIHQGGGDAVVAFGGAAGTDPSVSLSMSALSGLYKGLKKDFGVTRIDFDFETPGMYNFTTAFHAARDALTAFPELSFSLTLPVATNGLTQEGINMLTLAKQIGLPLTIQIMAMDYGVPGIDMGEALISAVEGTKNNLANLHPDKTEAELYAMIAVIPMVGQNDTQGELFTFEDAVTSAGYARQKGLNLFSMWSLARDFPGMGDLATCSRNPEQTQDYEYTSTFLKALG